MPNTLTPTQIIQQLAHYPILVVDTTNPTPYPTIRNVADVLGSGFCRLHDTTQVTIGQYAINAKHTSFQPGMIYIIDELSDELVELGTTFSGCFLELQAYFDRKETRQDLHQTCQLMPPGLWEQLREKTISVNQERKF